ncbi:hypothetical protein CYG49_00835 [Candidatus Saccharibacteria bacterium]|nr:MAG: hypothetical protein CYG49_00835 [Candidatus Saccharibacteria bacterium]
MQDSDEPHGRKFSVVPDGEPTVKYSREFYYEIGALKDRDVAHRLLQLADKGNVYQMGTLLYELMSMPPKPEWVLHHLARRSGHQTVADEATQRSRYEIIYSKWSQETGFCVNVQYMFSVRREEQQER